MTNLTMILPKVIKISVKDDNIKICSIKYDYELELPIHLVCNIHADGFTIDRIPNSEHHVIFILNLDEFEKSKVYKREIFQKYERTLKLEELIQDA